MFAYGIGDGCKNATIEAKKRASSPKTLALLRCNKHAWFALGLTPVRTPDGVSSLDLGCCVDHGGLFFRLTLIADQAAGVIKKLPNFMLLRTIVALCCGIPP